MSLSLRGGWGGLLGYVHEQTTVSPACYRLQHLRILLVSISYQSHSLLSSLKIPRVQGAGGVSTDFGTSCEASSVDGLFEIVTPLAWEVSPVRPPSTQGRQYPGYTINLTAEHNAILCLLPPMISGTLA